MKAQKCHPDKFGQEFNRKTHYFFMSKSSTGSRSPLNPRKIAGKRPRPKIPPKKISTALPPVFKVNFCPKNAAPQAQSSKYLTVKKESNDGYDIRALAKAKLPRQEDQALERTALPRIASSPSPKRHLIAYTVASRQGCLAGTLTKLPEEGSGLRGDHSLPS